MVRPLAAAMKKKGIGIFATKTLSADLAAICGKAKMPRTEVTKALWAYIKKNNLSKGRTITPDATLKKVCPVASFDMLKMATFVSKHLSWCAAVQAIRGAPREAAVRLQRCIL